MISAKNRAADTLPCTSTRGGASGGPAVSTWVRSRDVSICWDSTPGGRPAGEGISVSRVVGGGRRQWFQVLPPHAGSCQRRRRRAQDTAFTLGGGGTANQPIPHRRATSQRAGGGQARPVTFAQFVFVPVTATGVPKPPPLTPGMNTRPPLAVVAYRSGSPSPLASPIEVTNGYFAVVKPVPTGTRVLVSPKLPSPRPSPGYSHRLPVASRASRSVTPSPLKSAAPTTDRPAQPVPMTTPGAKPENEPAQSSSRSPSWVMTSARPSPVMSPGAMSWVTSDQSPPFGRSSTWPLLGVKSPRPLFA